MLQVVINKKLRGNTLPEVLIALCITSFCSVLGMTIYLNIQQSTMPFIRIKGNELAQKYLSEAIVQKKYFDDTYQDEEFTIRKTVRRNMHYPDCMDIKVSVFDNSNKKIGELQTIKYAE